MYAAQQMAASSAEPTPGRSLDGPGSTSTYTPAPAATAHSRSVREREPASPTASGPSTSSVTARPSPIRDTAKYRLRFITAKISASSSAGHHWDQVIRRGFGRATGSSTAAATSWRTATTPGTPIAGNACAPAAAPIWLAAPPASRARIRFFMPPRSAPHRAARKYRRCVIYTLGVWMCRSGTWRRWSRWPTRARSPARRGSSGCPRPPSPARSPRWRPPWAYGWCSARPGTWR